MSVLKVNDVSKFYGSFKAVDNVSFQVEKGEIFGLIGKNGAGKSTTLRSIMNIIIPDSGEIFLFNKKINENLKNNIGYLPEERGLYQKMTVLDQLRFLGSLKGMKSSDAKEKALIWLEKIELKEWAYKKINELSKGMAQKVQFIGTIIHNPDLIILDEPFSGLDPVNQKFLKDILLELKKEGKAIILSTHIMENAEKICDKICLINNGKSVINGALSEVKRKFSKNSVILKYKGDGQIISNLDKVKKVNDFGNYIEVNLKEDVKSFEFFRELAGTSLEISSFESTETSLEDVFIQVAGGENE